MELSYKKSNIDAISIEDLACKITGLEFDTDEFDNDIDIIEDALMEQLSIDLEGLSEIVNRLVPLISIADGRLSNKRYKGFSLNGVWIVKEKIISVDK